MAVFVFRWKWFAGSGVSILCFGTESAQDNQNHWSITDASPTGWFPSCAIFLLCYSSIPFSYLCLIIHFGIFSYWSFLSKINGASIINLGRIFAKKKTWCCILKRLLLMPQLKNWKKRLRAGEHSFRLNCFPELSFLHPLPTLSLSLVGTPSIGLSSFNACFLIFFFLFASLSSFIYCSFTLPSLLFASLYYTFSFLFFPLLACMQSFHLCCPFMFPHCSFHSTNQERESA